MECADVTSIHSIILLSYLKSLCLAKVSRIHSAPFPTVEIPHSSNTILSPFATLVPSRAVVYMRHSFPFQAVSCIILYFPPERTFILFTSRASSAIAAWQLLWSNTQTCHHPSYFGYLISAKTTARFISATNLSHVQ